MIASHAQAFILSSVIKSFRISLQVAFDLHLSRPCEHSFSCSILVLLCQLFIVTISALPGGLTRDIINATNANFITLFLTRLQPFYYTFKLFFDISMYTMSQCQESKLGSGQGRLTRDYAVYFAIV